jgi:N-hydroxyarylamine O-acetyltransferase
MHATDELPVVPVDLEMGHHYTSTYPGSHFTSGLILAKYLPDRHVRLTASAVTVRRPRRPTEHHLLADGEMRTWLAELGVTLTPDEVEELMALLPSLSV